MVQAGTPRGTATILRGIDLDIDPGIILGVVGESGSGKSTLALALIGLLPDGVTAQGRITLGEQSLLGLAEPAMRRLRGDRVAMVFQDPMTALNPLFTIGTQLADVLRRKHPDLRRPEALSRAAALLGRVGIADPVGRLRGYPHQLSGGMRQRVAIAMALAVEPMLLLADEPTSALDATVAAQVAALFRSLRADLSGSIVFISHRLGEVAQLCDAVCVLYGGVVVETGPVRALLDTPRHPYTRALLDCELDGAGGGRLRSIPGDVPDPVAPSTGCIFAPRCPMVQPQCRSTLPPLTTKAPGQRAACLLVPNAG